MMIPAGNTLKFLGPKKYWWLVISALIMVPGIVSLFIYKLPFGIDFKGGTVMEMAFEKTPSEGELRQKLLSYSEAKGVTVAQAEGGTYLIKTLPIEESAHQTIKDNLTKDFGTVSEKQFQSVGPSVSADLTRKAVYAIFLAALAIILYLAYSFRAVSYPVSSWTFGAVAVIALLHDLVISVGVFSLLAHFFHYEVDASFITALLTIMGFSVHDTIVVFDRIRENLSKNQVDTAGQFEALADQSLAETLNRSLATSLTVIMTLTTLTILGGASIRAFIVTLLVGISIGTYSSIFTATPLLVLWQNRLFKPKK